MPCMNILQTRNARRAAPAPHPGAAKSLDNKDGVTPEGVRQVQGGMGADRGTRSTGRYQVFGQQSTIGSYRDGSDWFMDLVGFREVQYEDTQQRLAVRADEASPGSWVLEGENGKVYKVGRFATPSLHELQTCALPDCGISALPGKLRVRNVCGEISYCLGDPENRHATFQVASQFNCLEYVHPHVTPEQGVTRYIYDRTQGPACCIACGPATVYRNYFAPVQGSAGQRHDRQLNNLRDLSAKLGNEESQRYFRMQGGYTLAEDQGLQTLGAKLESMGREEYGALRGELRVGVHEDVQVTSMDWGSSPVLDQEQTVTLVLGSACAVSYSGNRRELWEPMARLVLSASYEATLWASLQTAVRHGGAGGSRRVFLTCLGGGVFGNESTWIQDAMHEALSKFKDTGLEVYLVTYSGPCDRFFERLERDFGGP